MRVDKGVKVLDSRLRGNDEKNRIYFSLGEIDLSPLFSNRRMLIDLLADDNEISFIPYASSLEFGVQASYLPP